MKQIKIFSLLFFLPLLTLNCDGCGGSGNDFEISPDVTAGDGSGSSGDTGDSGGDTSGSSATSGTDSGATGSDSGSSTSGGDSTSGSGSGLAFDFDLGDITRPGHGSGGGAGSGSGDSETTGSTGTGFEPGNFPIGAFENPFNRPIDWHLAALWRGLEMEFTDGSCQNHKISKIGQSISFYPSQQDEHHYNLDITVSSKLQSKTKQSKSHDYRYKTHYTSVASNSKYLKTLEGSLWLSSDNLDDGVKTTTLDIVDYMLDGFRHPNSVNVDILLQGFETSFDDEIKPSTLAIDLDVEWDENNQLIVTANPQANSTVAYSMTVYYIVVFSDPDYVWVADNIFDLDENYQPHSALTSEDCGSSTCSFSYEIDPFVTSGLDELTYFTGLTGFGFSNANVGEIRKIRGYTNFKNGETDPETTLYGEAVHEKCGLTDKEVAPLNKTKALTFVCKDNTVCRANQVNFTNWENAHVKDTNQTGSTKNIEEPWYFETIP